LVGYTNTFGVYWAATSTGKRILTKNPLPIPQETEESSDDDESDNEAPKTPLQSEDET
jgi:hypothetical protein